MVTAVSYCSNCKTILHVYILEVDDRPLYLGVMACSLCHIINLDGKFADEIATKIGERNIEE